MKLKRFIRGLTASAHIYRPWLLTAALVPLVIHVLYKFSAPSALFESVWDAGELLDYAGSILGAFATIAALRWTIIEERTGRVEEQRLAAIPCIALTCLERRAVGDYWPNAWGHGDNTNAHVTERYCEYELEHEYITVAGENISYQVTLTDEQRRLASGSKYKEMAKKGLYCWTGNTSCYLPLIVHSAGNGPAVNVSLHLEKDGDCPPRNQGLREDDTG